MKYSQDFELWLRASSRVKIFSISEPLVSIRIHSKRISSHNNGDSQLIYSRACLIAYWLSKDSSIKPSLIYSNKIGGSFSMKFHYLSHIILTILVKILFQGD